MDVQEHADSFEVEPVESINELHQDSTDMNTTEQITVTEIDYDQPRDILSMKCCYRARIRVPGPSFITHH